MSRILIIEDETSIAELFEGGISLAESFSVAVDIFQALVDDYALGRQFSVASCVLGGVQWYEVIGHDAASTIYCAFVSQCLVSQGIGEMYAVCIHRSHCPVLHGTRLLLSETPSDQDDSVAALGVVDALHVLRGVFAGEEPFHQVVK